MSDELQKEYSDTYSTIKAEMSPAARLQIAGQRPSVNIVIPINADLPNGITIERNRTVSLPVTHILERNIKGRTVREALRSLFNDPVYKAMQDDPTTTTDLKVRDMPPAERRRQAAQVLIDATKTYYHLITRDALNRSSSPEAQQWRERRNAMYAERQSRNTDSIAPTARVLNGGTMTTTP